jgi:hypothetical protein
MPFFAADGVDFDSGDPTNDIHEALIKSRLGIDHRSGLQGELGLVPSGAVSQWTARLPAWHHCKVHY